MEIHILLAGEQIGPFSEAQIRQYLDEGLVSPLDLAMHDGMPTWESISHLLDRLPPSGSNTSTAKALKPETLSTMQNHAPETFEVGSPPDSSGLPPSPISSQKTKRKLGKIVIQPILPLEASAPLPKKKPRTGRTALTLEPLRPTTSLPPVSALPPRDKKATSGKALLRTGQLSLLNLSANSPPAPTVVPPLVDRTERAPTVEPPAVSPSPEQPPTETVTETPASTSWFEQLPRWAIYAAAGFALLIFGVIIYLIFVFSASQQTAPAAAALISPMNSPPTLVVQNSDAGPSTAADYRNRGIARQSRGDLEGAFEDYNQALILDPKDIEALFRRGLVRQSKSDFDGALADYTQVIALDPKRADAFSNRGFVKQATGDSDGAMADYTEALSLNPKIAADYYNEGLIQAQKGFLDSAITDFNQALGLDSKMTLAYYNRANAKNVEGDVDGAIADYTQALAQNPNLPDAFYKRGSALQTKGDFAGALSDYSRALALDPKIAGAFLNRGQIEKQKGNLQAAIDDTTRAIHLDPNNEQSYSIRGLARMGNSDPDGALSDLKTFCAMAPRDAGADTARVYLWLISTEKNPHGTADEELASALQNEWNSPPEELISKIAAFLLGHIHENDLIADAASPDPKREPAQYCQVWYFAGMKRLLMGDTKAAIADLQKSVVTEQSSEYDYLLAQAELKALSQSRNLASKHGSNP